MIFFVIFLIVVALGACRLAQKIMVEKIWRTSAEKGVFSNVKKEPFPGALALCGIIMVNIKDSEQSAKIMESVFGKKGTDWFWMCRALAASESLNRDLLIESLVGIIKKQDSNFQLNYIPLFFRAITASEFMWNNQTGSEKPSEYLKGLLNYSFKEDENADAYRVLGLEPGTSLEKVKRAHRRLVAKYHPDKNPESGNLEMFLKIQTAFETIYCASHK